MRLSLSMSCTQRAVVCTRAPFSTPRPTIDDDDETSRVDVCRSRGRVAEIWRRTDATRDDALGFSHGRGEMIYYNNMYDWYY